MLPATEMWVQHAQKTNWTDSAGIVIPFDGRKGRARSAWLKLNGRGRSPPHLIEDLGILQSYFGWMIRRVFTNLSVVDGQVQVATRRMGTKPLICWVNTIVTRGIPQRTRLQKTQAE